jgi:hypothetical protein
MSPRRAEPPGDVGSVISLEPLGDGTTIAGMTPTACTSDCIHQEQLASLREQLAAARRERDAWLDLLIAKQHDPPDRPVPHDRDRPHPCID